MPKKVLHVHFWDDIRNTASSVEKVIMAFAENAQDWQHAVACRPRDNASLPPLNYRGVSVFPFQESTILNRIFNKLFRLDIFTYPQLARLINREHPDVVHIHNRQDKVDQLVAKLNYQPRVVVHYHRHFRQPSIPSSADLFVYPSNATRLYMEKMGAAPDKGMVLHNPLTSDLMSQLAQGAFIQEPVRPLRFLFGGGANPVKGGKELLSAFRLWERADASLLMVGNGAEVWADCGDSRVHVHGGLDSAAFLRLMNESDVVLMPSHTEAFGLIAQEAMCMRKPLVTTRVDGLAELVPSDGAIVVEPGSVESLLVGLEVAYQVCMNPDRHQQLTEKAYRAMQSFDPKNIVCQLEHDIYEGNPS